MIQIDLLAVAVELPTICPILFQEWHCGLCVWATEIWSCQPIWIWFYYEIVIFVRMSFFHDHLIATVAFSFDFCVVTVFYPFHGDRSHVFPISPEARIFRLFQNDSVDRISLVSLISRGDCDAIDYANDWIGRKMMMMNAIDEELKPNSWLCSQPGVLNGIFVMHCGL